MTGSGSAPGRLAPRKGLHPAVWVLIAFATILAVLIATIAITGWYLVNQFSENPVATTDKVLSVLDPDLEVVSGNAEKLSIRDKQTGHTIDLTWNELKRTFIRVSSDGRQMSLNFAKLNVHRGKDDLPAWLPLYPGARIRRSVQVDNEGGISGSLKFETSDRLPQVFAFYEQQLTTAGLKPIKSDTDLSAVSPDGGRESQVHATATADALHVILSYTARN